MSSSLFLVLGSCSVVLARFVLPPLPSLMASSLMYLGPGWIPGWNTSNFCSKVEDLELKGGLRGRLLLACNRAENKQETLRFVYLDLIPAGQMVLCL